jgi:DNA-binding transcriptional ArsR family regulator
MDMKNEKEYWQDTAEQLKLIAHPVRLCILSHLVEHQSINVSQMMQCLDEPQATVSGHLQKLKMAQLVLCERRGKEIFYRLANHGYIKDIIDVLKKGEANI